MEKRDKKSPTSNNGTSIIDNAQDNVQKNDTIPFEIHAQDNIVKEKISQLLSVDGWENYKKELIRLCFEYWEVNETQEQVTNGLECDFKMSGLEIQTTPLFPERRNIDFEPKATLDNVIIPKGLQNEECVDGSDNFLKSKHEDGTVIQWFSKVLNNNIDWKANENGLKTVNIKRNKRAQKKKANKFSFYKHMSNQVKRKKHSPPCTLERFTSCVPENQWEHKEWVDSSEKIKTHDPNVDDTSHNDEENSDEISCDGTRDVRCNDTFEYSSDVEVHQMEEKVKKLVESLREKDRPTTSSTAGTANEHTTKFGSSNKLKCFFKNAFRTDQNDLCTLDEYTNYVNENMRAWQTLSRCLEDVRRRAERFNIETAANDFPAEDTTTTRTAITYRFCEGRDHCGEKITTDDCDDGHGTGKRSRKKFFNLLNKTAKRTAAAVAERNAAPRDGGTTNRTDDGMNAVRNGGDALTVDRRCSGDRGTRPVRKSRSDTDLPATVRRPERAGTVSAVVADRGPRDGGARHGEPCDARQRCFRAAVARLEYVGSAFGTRRRLPGLKTLCRVDVLASLGRSAEAVDLFVSAALPLSDDPDLMARRAEAAYDWTFFCHLCMWRHSYKDV